MEGGKGEKKGGGGGKLGKKYCLEGIEPGTFSLEDHNFDHQAKVFQAYFLMET